MLPELDPLLLASSSKRSIPPGQTKHYRGVSNRQVYTAFARFRKTANHASQKIAAAYFAPEPDLKAYARVVGYSCRRFCPCRSQNSILRPRDRKSDAGTKKKHHPRKDHHFNSPCKPPRKRISKAQFSCNALFQTHLRQVTLQQLAKPTRSSDMDPANVLTSWLGEATDWDRQVYEIGFTICRRLALKALTKFWKGAATTCKQSKRASTMLPEQVLKKRMMTTIMQFEQNWQTRPMRTSHVIDLMTLTPEQTPSPA